MEQVRLAQGGRATTRLGYGCSSIMGALGRGQSLKLLESAFEAGFRHFDVAPMYGYGEAESCVGEFLARHPGAVTVTTKYGIAPPKRGGLLRAARRVVGPLVGKVPAVKKRLARAAGAVAAPAERAKFSAEEARLSLENSLRALRVEFIDVWLLHEAEAPDLRDEGLLRFLEEAVASGKIGSFGVGSDSAKIAALLRERPAYCGVLQHEWSVFDGADQGAGAFHIHHRALTEHFRTLHARMSGDGMLARRWSDIAGVNVADRPRLAALMLKAALVLHPESVLLVSSKNAAHIRENVRVAEDETLAEPARRLYELVQCEIAGTGAPNPLREEGR